MTIRQKLEKMLVDRGMFDTQAAQVMDQAIPVLESLLPNDYRVDWNRPAGGEGDYPDVLYGVWFMTVRHEAVKWIDVNAPKAWYRDMFTD